jgi:hypothetical protein
MFSHTRFFGSLVKPAGYFFYARVQNFFLIIQNFGYALDKINAQEYKILGNKDAPFILTTLKIPPHTWDYKTFAT